MAQAMMRRDYTSFLTGPKNLSMTERTMSVIGGLGLAALAVQPRPNKWLSLAALIGGSMLAMRGATGHCAAKASLLGR
jgi:hypothetical protein